MFFDVQDQVMTNQVIANTTAVVSTDAIDKQTTAHDITIGSKQMAFVFCVGAYTDNGNVTTTLEAIEATDSALTAGIVSLGKVDVPVALLKAGAVFVVPMAPGSMGAGKYIGARVKHSTGATTSITLNTYLMPVEEVPKWKPFPKMNAPKF